MTTSLDMLRTIRNNAESKGISVAEALQESGIEKEELLVHLQEGDFAAAILLLLGMVSHKQYRWIEDFEDEDTGKVIKVERSSDLDSFIFEADPGEIDDLEKRIAASAKEQSDDTLLCWWNMGIHGPIASELAKRKHVPALEWLGDYYAGYYSDDYSFSIDRDKATEYYTKALAAGMSKEKFESSVLRLKYGVRHGGDSDWVFDGGALDDLRLLIKNYPDHWWSFDECCWQLLDFKVFNQWHSESSEGNNCSIKELKDELISRGMPEPVSIDDGKSIRIDLRNLSFYMAVGEEEEDVAPDNCLAISLRGRDKNPEYNYDLGSFGEMTANFIVDLLSEMDDTIPDVRMSLSLCYDKLLKAEA